MSLVSRATGFALKSAAKAAGESITYTVDGEDVAITNAFQGDTNWDADNPQPGLKIGHKSTDWIVEAAQLIDSEDNQLTPQRDAVITAADGRTFQCLPFGKYNQLFRYVDRGGRTYFRIHTKER